MSESLKNLEIGKTIKEPIENFDWDSITNDGHIFRYRERNSIKLSKNQVQILDLYEGKPVLDKNIEAGMVVTGVIKSISKREMVVDINYKDDIFVEQKLSDWNVISGFNVGDDVDVLVKEVQEKPYIIKGSVVDLLKMRVNEKIVEYFNENKSLVGVVTEVIPAGYMLNIELDKITLPAFMPNTLADVNKLYDPSILMGKKIDVMIETLQQEKGVYVVSRKKYLKTLIPEKIKNLKYDVVYEGYVTGTTPFGVFVQFEECLTGMIHKMNINAEYRDKIQEIQPGTLIDFYIKEITKVKKLILTQNLTESMWDTIKNGSIMSGEVISIKPFGALVKLDYETIGLLQSSYLNRSKKQIKVGEMIDVRIVNIMKDDRKIYLSFADNKPSTSVEETPKVDEKTQE